MVNGIDIFRNHFSEFKDQYTIIGGFACDLSNFIEQMRITDMRLTDIGITRSKDSILDVYSNMYIAEQTQRLPSPHKPAD